MSDCIATPISWLRLERYELGELDEASRVEVETHLSTCPACTACLDRIRRDARDLPPLVAAAAPKANGRIVMLRRASAIVGALAAAAVLVVALGTLPRDDERSNGTRVKGNNVAFSLVREDQRRVEEAGALYQSGERFKALVTCPPGMRASFDLVVFEHDVPSFPLAAPLPRQELECGNDVPLPGAFRVTGREALTVCLVWNDEAPIDRDAITRSESVASERRSCKDLVPSP